MPPGQGGGQPQIPPELVGHVDPNNKIQMLLLQRVDSLSEQDAKQFFDGIQPPALMILKRIIPELGFMIDAMLKQMQMGGAAQPGGGAPMPAPGGGAPPAPPVPPSSQPPQFAPQRPSTKLGSF